MFSIVVLVLAILCLAAFQWARWRFFSNPGRSPKTALSRAGTVFGLGSLIYLVYFVYRGMSNQSLAAIILFVFSLALFFLSINSHKMYRPAIAGAGVVPEDVVQTGPYRLVRHPIYSAYQIFWAGMVAAAPSIFTLIGFLVMGALYYREARREEVIILQSDRAKLYQDYCLKAGMFVPRFWLPRR